MCGQSERLLLLRGLIIAAVSLSTRKVTTHQREARWWRLAVSGGPASSSSAMLPWAVTNAAVLTDAALTTATLTAAVLAVSVLSTTVLAVGTESDRGDVMCQGSYGNSIWTNYIAVR